MENRHIDLSCFKNMKPSLVAKNGNSWRDAWGNINLDRVRAYSKEEIVEILNSSNLVSQQRLSRSFFDRNGLYNRLIYYYATLLTYSGLLIPNPSFGKQLSTPHIAKRYHQSLDFLGRIELNEIMTRMSIRALIYGCYYGIIQKMEKDDFVIFDLPPEFCRSNYRDIYGNDVIEFDVRYFNSISDGEMREEALKTYPKIVASYYRKFAKGKISNSWVKLPTDIGICISFFDDGRPLFLNIIPATIQYDEAVETEREREMEEIRKIIVQQIPHLNDGQLLFEPPEAEVMHEGSVKMLSNNPNVSVLTTYADVEAIVSKAASDDIAESLEKMLQNVYAEAGVSSQLFAPTGSQALPTSILNDMSLMMILANKYARLFTHILNELFANFNVNFTYKILPLTNYNRTEFLDNSLKLAQSGYSFLLPAIASGLNQRDIVNVKGLENEVLKLNEQLIPLSSSFTQSGSTTEENESKEVGDEGAEGSGAEEAKKQVEGMSGSEGGRPEKDPTQKADKTIQNQNSTDQN